MEKGASLKSGGSSRNRNGRKGSQGRKRGRESGLSLSGFLFAIVIGSLAAILGMKVVPTVTEFSSIKRSLEVARTTGTSVRDIQSIFDKQATTGYIESVSGKDLHIVRTAEGFDVGVAYQKKIELFGPVSLLIDYAAGNIPAPQPK